MKKLSAHFFGSTTFISILVFMILTGGNFKAQAQTIGIVQGLTLVNPRQGPLQPGTGSPTVEIPVMMGNLGELYVNRFYKYNTNGQLEDVIAVPVNYDPVSFTGWYGYCVMCSPGDLPPLYRAVTLNCLIGSVTQWNGAPWSDPTVGVETNSCTNSVLWSNPLTWADYKVPNPATGAFYLNRNVSVDVNFDAIDKAIYSNNGSALTINSGVTFTSFNTNSGRFINNGVLKGVGQYSSVVNNGVVSPGGNGIGQFQGAGAYTQNAGGSLNMQLASTTSFDKLYWTSGSNVLGGTLKVSLLNGFVPVQNNSFNIIEMSYATYTGSFSNVDAPVLPNNLKWQVSYNPTDIRLTIVDSSTLGGAFNFSSGGYGTIPTNGFPVGNSNYTIESWVKTSDNSYNTVMFWGNTNTNAANAVRLEPGGKIRNYWWNNDLVVDAPTVNDGNWHHIAASFDGTTRNIYMDGIMLGSDNPSGHNISAGTTCFLGGGGYQDPFKGSLDEVRVFTMALTQAEINSSKNCEIPANTPGLSAYYKFNQGLANQNNNIITHFTDASPNGNNSNLWGGYALVDMVNNFVEGAIVNGQTCGSCSGPAVVPANVFGYVNVCPYIGNNTPLTYSVAPDLTASGYQWTLPPTLTLISGQGTNSITVTVGSGFAANANKVIKVKVLSSCGNSGEKLFYLVAQLPSTASVIAATTTNICANLGTNIPVTFSIAKIPSASSYIWTAQSGTTTIVHPNGTGVNDTLITVTFTNGFTNSNITVQAFNDCGTGSARGLAINRNNLTTPGLISGPTNACPYISPNGTAANYSIVPVANAASYTWSIPAGVIGLTGQGSPTISFIYPPGFTIGSVSVTSTNGCGQSPARTQSISTLNPATPGVIDVINTVSCPSRQYTYTIATMPSNATSVVWTVPAGATIISGQGSISITVSYPNTVINGSVTVQASNNCKSSTIRSVTVKLAACPVSFAGKYNGSDKIKPKEEETIIVKEMNVSISPNPTVNDFRLQVITPGKEFIIVHVMDAGGRLLKQLNIRPYESITIGAELKAGVYLIQVRQGKSLIIKRVIKF